MDPMRGQPDAQAGQLPLLPRWRRLVLGPWSRWIRDWIDLFRLSFAVSAIVLVVIGNGEAWRMAATFFLSLLPRIFATPARFDLAFNIGMAMQAWGNVTRIFYTWLGYHDIVHFWLTGATAVLIYFSLLVLRLVPDLAEKTQIRQKAGIAALTFAIGSTINTGYELYEYFDDNLLGGHLLENYHHTMFDLFFGGLGSVTAGVALALWAVNSWATRRPAGGDPLAELRDRLERLMERGASDRAAIARSRRQQSAERRRAAVRLRDGGGTRLIGGDWTPVVRDVSDLARISMVAGVGVAAIIGNLDDVVRFAVALLFSLAVRWLKPPRAFEMLFNAALLLGTWAAFAGVLHADSIYDDATNVALSLASTSILYVLLIRARVLPDIGEQPGIHRYVSLFLAAMCLGFCVGIYYVQYVWVANHYLGASVPTSWTELTRRLALDWVGAIAGAVLLVAWQVQGLGTWRRMRPRHPASVTGGGLGAGRHGTSS